MKKISLKDVERKFSELSQLDEEGIKSIVRKMEKEQPYILTYLYAIGEDYSETGREMLMSLGIMSWQIMLEAEKNLPTIEPELLDEMEERNMKMLDDMKDIEDEDFIKRTEELIEDYPQPDLLTMVVEMLFEEENDIDLDERAMIFIFIKIVIDSLQKAGESLKN